MLAPTAEWWTCGQVRVEILRQSSLGRFSNLPSNLYNPSVSRSFSVYWRACVYVWFSNRICESTVVSRSRCAIQGKDTSLVSRRGHSASSNGTTLKLVVTAVRGAVSRWIFEETHARENWRVSNRAIQSAKTNRIIEGSCRVECSRGSWIPLDCCTNSFLDQLF